MKLGILTAPFENNTLEEVAEWAKDNSFHALEIACWPLSNDKKRYSYIWQIEKVKQETKVGGATLTKLLGTSAWYAPGAAVSGLVQAIACDQKKMFPCSVLLEGEYGLDDLSIGVPVILGKNGIEEIVKIELSEADMKHLHESAEGVKKTNNLLAL